jgi:DNA primase
MKRQLIGMSLLLLTIVGCGKDARITQLESAKDVKGLITLLQQQDELSAQAAESLGTIANKQAVEPLIKALKNSSERDTRRAAAEALGKIKDVRAAKPLLEVVDDQDQILQRKAKTALQELAKQDPKVIQMLMTALKNDSAGAKAVLVSVGQPAVEPLIAALKDVNGTTRLNAASALGDIGDPKAIKPLVANLNDWGISPIVGSSLEKMQWQPANDREKILYLVALGDADELRKNWQMTKSVLLKEVESENYKSIQFGLYSFISLGNQEIIPALVNSLNNKGNKNMALAYLNSNQPALEKAAQDWAAARGYQVVKTNRKDVQPVKWGGL